MNLTGGILNGLVVNSGTANLSGGRVDGLANIVNGILVSTQNIGQLQVGSYATANIFAGQVGNTNVSGILSATGGMFASITSGNITRLTSATVSGLSNVTGGIFTANATLGNLTIQPGALANLTDGSANVTTVAGGILFANSTSITSLAVNSGSATITGGAIHNPITGTSANHVTITNYAQSLIIGQLSASTITVNVSNGTITQAVGSNMVVANTVDLIASGNISLSNSTNDFQGRVLAHGTNITLNDINAITLDQIILTGDLHVTAGTITVTHDITSASKNQTYCGAVFSTGGDRTLTATNVNITNSTDGGGFDLEIIGNAITAGSVSNVSNLSITGTSIRTSLEPSPTSRIYTSPEMPSFSIP